MTRGKRTPILFALLAILLVLAVAAAYFATRNYASYFAWRKGELLRADPAPVSTDSLFEKSWLTLKNADGFTVNCGMLVPLEKGRKYPAIILLGGKATGKYAVDYALDIRDVILIAPDYPYEPRESYTIPQFLADVPEIHESLVDMVPSVLLLTDYLYTRPDVDTTRLVLVGYSFGAPFVPCIMAHDRRPAAAAMVYGAGDLRTLIRHNVNRYESKPIGELVGYLAGVLLRPLEPMRYVGRISPRPLLMINGTDDEQIPRENVEMLYQEAREPKRIIWLESRHVNPRNVELTRKIVAALKEGLSGLGVLEYRSDGKAKE